MKMSPKTQTSKSKHKHIEEIENKLETKMTINHHCKLCGAGFAQINNFTKHLQTHNEHDMYI